ncbi:MAG TPA: AAA family ATPase [Caldilineaceae bacterium]|nr:AAA family ATPase [Caldilineaceae bacterium]
MQKLPIGEQFFARLRERNLLYVDKTEQIFNLMNVGSQVFLSRPRRFGKSLLTTTLKEIYRGNRALFQGLWIEDKLDWQPRPVILINFNALNYRERSLAEALADQMDKLASDYNLTLSERDHKGKFRELILLLAEQNDVILLIDEYDKPLTDHLEDEAQLQENIATLRNFYSVLKSPEGERIYFTFITGVSKYGKISIFSELNNLLDITLDVRFAMLLGYTQTELEHYFSDYIDRLVTTFQTTHAEILKQIARWYDGYSWDGAHTVYVPYSTLLFLEQQTFTNHWYSTGTPSFLIKLLRSHHIPAYQLADLSADATLLESADVNDISVLSLLFQTGYLTIKARKDSFLGTTYNLGYPNYEVAQSFQRHLLADYLDQNVDRISSSLLQNLQRALATRSLDAFITIFQSVFATIPSHLFLPQEAYYHSVVYLVLKLLGFTIHAEWPTNLGRIDAVLELPDTIYLLEFKMSSGAIALQQIRDKQYAQPFLGSDKTVILLGIAFDRESRNIVDWKHA